MNRAEFEKMKAEEAAFIKDFIALCKKHDLAIQSDDPDCGLEIVSYDEMKEYYNDKTSFGRWGYEYIERDLEEN